jgi:hypothetical protein
MAQLGAWQTPSCWRREVAFVLIRPVHRLIDGGGLSGLACRSPGPARSTARRSLMCTVTSAPSVSRVRVSGRLCRGARDAAIAAEGC